MKTMKVRKVIDLLRKDGWEIDRINEDHRQFRNKKKPGTVTVSGKESDDLTPFLIRSIWRQAGWKE